MIATSEPSKMPDVRKAPLQVLPDPDPAVSESEQEPGSLGLVCGGRRSGWAWTRPNSAGKPTSCAPGSTAIDDVEGVTMHQAEWERLTADEKLEQLRLHQVAQDGLIRAMMAALERLGMTFVEDAEDAAPCS